MTTIERYIALNTAAKELRQVDGAEAVYAAVCKLRDCVRDKHIENCISQGISRSTAHSRFFGAVATHEYGASRLAKRLYSPKH